MRKVLLVLLLSVTCAATVMAQGIGGPSLVYSNSTMAVDPHGNLLIFDTSYAFTSVVLAGNVETSVNIPVTVPPVRQLVTPSTKVTVIPGGTGTAISKVYSGTFEIVGTGKWALYAIVTPYVTSTNQVTVGARELIAIDAGPSGNVLPELSGFFNTALNNGDVKLNASTGSAPDILYNLQKGLPILPPVSATAVARVERTITFGGTGFAHIDVSLP
jgi:hypothetical protein